MPTTLGFNRIDRVVLVPESVAKVTCQEIYDQCRGYEDEPGNLDIGALVAGSGKDDLGGGRYTGVTVKLINDWRLQFEARTEWTICWVTGGNLIAVNQYENVPIKPSAYVNVIIAQSTEAALLEAESSGLTQEETETLSRIDDNVNEVHMIHGLSEEPLDVCETKRVAGDIIQSIQQDVPELGTVRVTRQ